MSTTFCEYKSDETNYTHVAVCQIMNKYYYYNIPEELNDEFENFIKNDTYKITMSKRITPCEEK